jgi:hypothetical protein
VSILVDHASLMLNVVRNHALSFSSSHSTSISEDKAMNTGMNDRPSILPDDKAQIWIIGTREQVLHLINELYVKKIAPDRAQFTPIIPAPFAKGKFMSVLER